MADLKQLARQIFLQTLAAIDIPAAMQRKLTRVGTRLRCDSFEVDLRAFDRVCVVAIGKAAHSMVRGLEGVLGDSVKLDGVVAAPTTPSEVTNGLEYFAAGHPIPNSESWKAAESILALLKSCNERTLVFFL